MTLLKIKRIEPFDITPQFMDSLKIAFPTSDDNPSWDFKATKSFIMNKANILLIAYKLGNMAGYLFGHKLDRFDQKKEFFIYELYTSKAFRREKVMSSIIDFLLDLLRQDGYSSAWLLTCKSNREAVSFYTNTGASIPYGDDVLFEYKIL